MDELREFVVERTWLILAYSATDAIRVSREEQPDTFRVYEGPLRRWVPDEPFDLAAEADRVAALYADSDREELAEGIHASLVNLYERMAGIHP